jgi:hypothetical protein
VSIRDGSLRCARIFLYLSDQEVKQMKIPNCELWQVVKLQLTDSGCVSWLHEREWHLKGDFSLPSKWQRVLVRNPACAEKLQKLIAETPMTDSTYSATVSLR